MTENIWRIRHLYQKQPLQKQSRKVSTVTPLPAMIRHRHSNDIQLWRWRRIMRHDEESAKTNENWEAAPQRTQRQTPHISRLGLPKTARRGRNPLPSSAAWGWKKRKGDCREKAGKRKRREGWDGGRRRQIKLTTTKITNADCCTALFCRQQKSRLLHHSLFYFRAQLKIWKDISIIIWYY